MDNPVRTSDERDANAANSYEDAIITDDEVDRLSVSSTRSESYIAMTGIERANCSPFRRSRIPLLSRSASLKEKRISLDDGRKRVSSKRNIQSTKENSPTPGLYRSASFATSRGLTGITSINGHGQVPSAASRLFFPLTPEIPRKKYSNYVSPYSKKVIYAERKQSSLTERNLKSDYIQSADDIDAGDCHSENSFESGSSMMSCDDPITPCRSTPIWNKRPSNILHCRHTGQEDQYLTPTQRANRKIRELKSELREARRQIAEKDTKIMSLTKELVELRLNKAEEGFECKNKSPCPQSTDRNVVEARNETERNIILSKSKKSLKSKKLTSMQLRLSSCEEIPVNGNRSPCNTPPSDSSEPELRRLKETNDRDYNSTKSRRRSAGASPDGTSLEGSESLEFTRSSLADSGHYEDLPSPALSAKSSFDSGRVGIRKMVRNICTEEDSLGANSIVWTAIEAAERRVKEEYERRLEELQNNQMNEYHELKERHNDHVESLLAKLSDANLRYFELRPQFDKCQERIRELEKSNSKLKEELKESEFRHQKIYLQMFLKGKQAAHMESEDELSAPGASRSSEGRGDSRSSSIEKIDINDDKGVVLGLMRQLADSEEEILKLKALYHQEMARSKRLSRGSLSHRKDEIDPEITLQFLKSAIYYFLTDKDNSNGHLRAIESILGYSSTERLAINRQNNP